LNKILFKILLVLVITLPSLSCTKEYKAEEKVYYFLKGVVINDQPPIFKLFKMNLYGSVEVPYNQYDIVLKNSLGEVETILNGEVKNIIGKSGITYFVKWKRKTETKWHELEKKLPEYDTSLKSNNIYETLDNYSIDTKTDGYGFYLGQNLNLTNTSAWSGLYFDLTRGIGGNLIDLNAKNNKVILWPPAYKNISSAGVRFDFYLNINCHKPFTWTNQEFEEMVLYQTNIQDFNNNLQHQNNIVKSGEPLYTGNPNIYDYKNDINFGNLYTYNIYRYIKLAEILKIEGDLNFKIYKNGEPFTSNDGTILNVFVETEDFSFVANQYSNSGKTIGRLLFKDYIDYQYVTQLNKKCSIKESYSLNFRVHYRNPQSNERLTYFDLQNLNYSGQSDTIIINIP
jgi:hypothetical protein